MSPQTNAPRIPITVLGKAMGEYYIAIVLVRDISWAEQQRIRTSGQIDCGKRQSVQPLTVQHLPAAIVDRLFEENLIDQDSDLLEFGGAMFGNGDTRSDAHRAAQIICQMDSRFGMTEIDRSIPCS